MTVFKTLCIIMLLSFPWQGKAQLQKVSTQLKFIKFKIPLDTIYGWSREGVVTININQSAYDKWQNDANNHVELDVTLNQRFNYKTPKMLWDNYIIAELALNKLQNQKIRKTQDRLEFNTIVGYQLPKNWSASFFLNLQTQLSNTYDYDHDKEKAHRINGFLAPLYVSSGPGVMWKKGEHLNFNIAPITTKLTLVNGNIFRYNADDKTFESDNQTNILGVEPGKKHNLEMGFYSSGLYQFHLSKHISVENRLALYANYLHDFSNIDVDYSMRMNLDVNKLLSTQLLLQIRYDDDAIKRIQLRQAFGVGIKLNF